MYLRWILLLLGRHHCLLSVYSVLVNQLVHQLLPWAIWKACVKVHHPWHQNIPSPLPSLLPFVTYLLILHPKFLHLLMALFICSTEVISRETLVHASRFLLHPSNWAWMLSLLHILINFNVYSLVQYAISSTLSVRDPLSTHKIKHVPSRTCHKGSGHTG